MVHREGVRQETRLWTWRHRELDEKFEDARNGGSVLWKASIEISNASENAPAPFWLSNRFARAVALSHVTMNFMQERAVLPLEQICWLRYRFCSCPIFCTEYRKNP